MNRRIDKSRKNRDKETKWNTSLIDLSLQQIDSEACPQEVTGRFAYGSFRLLSVRLRLESIRLRPVWQFEYVLMMSLTQINRWKRCVNIPRSKKAEKGV